MLIKILDTNFSKTDQPNLLRVEEFSFKKEFYKKTKFGVQRHEYNGYAINTNGTFLTGLIPSITQYCHNNAITYNIENYLPPPLLAQNISHLFTLREDQKKCIEIALNTDRGIIKSPTGSGKTVLIAAIISAFPEAKILFLCHTLSLLKQTQEEFNKYNIGPSSIIDGSKKDISGKIIISTVQSLSKTKLLESLYNKFNIVFVDECFAKGTKIETPTGKISIEKIISGQSIFNKNGKSIVLQTFKIKISLDKIISITKSDGKKIYCTKDHLFLTDKNQWIKAEKLQNNFLYTFSSFIYMTPNIIYNKEEKNYVKKNIKNTNKLFLLWEKIRKNSNQFPEILFQKMFSQQRDKYNLTSRSQNSSYLQRLWKNNDVINKRSETILFKSLYKKNPPNKIMPYLWQSIFLYFQILFQKMWIYGPQKKRNIFKNNDKNKSKICFGKNEEEQPVTQSTDYRKRETNKKNKWYLRSLEKQSWRKWETLTNTSAIISNCIRMANRIFSKNSVRAWKWKIQTFNWISKQLQNRYCKSKTNDRNRNRWILSFLEWRKRNRSEKNRFVNRIRVENIEIYKRGYNDKSFSNIIGNKERNQGFVEFYDLEIDEHPSYFAEGVLVHNCHHAASTTGLYAKVLTKLTALRRYGVTATMPKNKEGEFALEGLIGPKIADFTIEEAINQEILAIPTVELISVPTCEAIKDIKKYADTKLKDNYGKFILDKNGAPIVEKGIYNIGICEYRKRNRLIIETALEKNKKGESILIYVTMIAHGERLVEIANLMGASPIFIRGSSDAELREETRQALHNKVALLAICTQAWAEGINIRSLDCILLAGGGKSEIALIQHIGRGLRRTETKKTATIIDLLDTGRYLSEHCVARLKVYVEKGWL